MHSCPARAMSQSGPGGPKRARRFQMGLSQTALIDTGIADINHIIAAERGGCLRFGNGSAIRNWRPFGRAPHPQIPARISGGFDARDSVPPRTCSVEGMGIQQGWVEPSALRFGAWDWFGKAAGDFCDWWKERAGGIRELVAPEEGERDPATAAAAAAVAKVRSGIFVRLILWLLYGCIRANGLSRSRGLARSRLRFSKEWHGGHFASKGI